MFLLLVGYCAVSFILIRYHIVDQQRQRTASDEGRNFASDVQSKPVRMNRSSVISMTAPYRNLAVSISCKMKFNSCR